MLGFSFQDTKGSTNLTKEVSNLLACLGLRPVNNKRFWRSNFLAEKLESIDEFFLRFHSVDFDKSFVAHEELHHRETSFTNNLLAEERIGVEQ